MARVQTKVMSPSPVDVAIVVALDEEYKILSNHPLFTLAGTVTYGKVTITQFNYVADGRERLGIFVRVDAMAEAARDAVHLVHRTHDARHWISAGISAALSSDVHPGDIIIADSVSNPLEKARVESRAEGLGIRMAGGQPTIASADVKVLHQRWRDDAAEQIAFKRNARMRLDQYVSKAPPDAQGSMRSAMEAILSRQQAPVHVGPIASGPFLSAAQELKEALLGTNRKLLAYDMEAAEVGGALASLDESSRFLALRTVSDYGDKAKGAFEADTRGVVRTWALQGLTDFLAYTLKYGLPYPRADLKPAKANRRANPPPAAKRQSPQPVRKSAPSLGYFGARVAAKPVVAEWDARYRALIGSDAFPKTDSPITTLQTVLRNVHDGGRQTVLIAGPAGSGKTLLLELLERLWPGRETKRINATAAGAPHVDSDEPAGIVAERLIAELGLGRTRQPTLILVDDVDLDSEFSRLLVDGLNRAAQQCDGCCLVLSAVAGEPNIEDFPSRIRGDHWIPLHAVSPGSPFYEEFVQSFSNLLPSMSPPISFRDLRQRIDALAPKSIDPQFVSVLLENWTNARFQGARTAAQFALSTVELLGGSVAGPLLPENFVQLCAADAFMRYSADPSPNLPSAVAAAPFQKVRRTGDWVQEALVAEFAVDAVVNAGKAKALSKLERSALERVYDIRVSGLVKQIVLHTDNGAILTGIEKLLAERDVAITPFLVYILGRIEDQHYRARAKRLLADLSAASTANFQDWQSTNVDPRLVSLAHRAVYISRAYQNDRDAAVKYVGLLAQSPEESALNRGFHVEYFRDRIVRPKAGLDGYMLQDETSGPWLRTYGVLSASVDHELRVGSLTPKGIVELGTLCSFVAARLDRAELANALRDPIRQLLLKTVGRADVPNVLRGVVSAILHELDAPARPGPFALFETVYRLKHEERAGWRARGLEARLGYPAERVASHIFGACLLALWLLPDKPRADFQYSKTRVIKLLMIHDLGEAVIGDQTPDERHKSPDSEAGAVARITGMAMMPTLSNLHGLFEDWQDFEDHRTNDAKVARDVDYLEALLQATLYRQVFPSVENYQHFVIYHQDRIQTPPGHEILQAILLGAAVTPSHEVA